MPEYLTRALQLAQKLRQTGLHVLRMYRQTLARAWHRVSNLVRQYAPIIRRHLRNTGQCLLQLCRVGLDHTARFAHRAIFRVTVLGIKIAEFLRYYTPIVREFIFKVSRQCLDHTLRFISRVVFKATVLCIKIAEFLRYYTPIVRDFIVKLSRLCLDRALRFASRVVFMTTVLGIRIAEFLRHYTPIVWQFLKSNSVKAWRGALKFCQYCLERTAGFLRRMAVLVTAFCLGTMAGVRHYLPIILQATNRGLQVTAQALVTCGRWCMHWAGRMVRAITESVLSILARAAKIIRELLRAVKNLLLRVGWALITFCRVAGRYLGQGSRHLLHTSRIISARAGERLNQYLLLMRLNKPIGIFLLLWPTLWALWIAADGTPDLFILLIFIGGVVLMRSAGCIINDLADRDFDAQVSRTRQRPLATGKVTPKEALVVAGVLILCAFLLVLQLNTLTIGLSVVGVLLAIIYPFTKRYTYMPQFFLGLAFGWAVPMAFAAQTGAVPAIGWILLMATVLWALVYDTMYAMVDREEDISLGIKSTAILFEDADRIIIGVIQLLVVLTLLLIGYRLDFNKYYYAGLAIAALLFIYQQHLIRDRNPEQCFRAFLNNNWVGAMVFGGILMNYQYG